jgi:hypothetical protein
MTQLSSAEWKRLETLAAKIGASPEQVGAVRRRMEPNHSRPGSPYTLLTGRPDGGLELLLARWAGLEATQALKRAGEKPLILGSEPEQVRPALGVWPTLAWKTFHPGHLIALRSCGKPAADLLAQLGSLGYFEQLVLVTRLGKPLDQVEREMARSLSPLSVTARVLVVALAGEEPTDDDLAEIAAYGAAQMRQIGLHSGRYLGTGVWFATNQPDRPGIVSDVGSFLEVDSTAVAAQRAGMLQQGVAVLLDDLSSRCQKNAEPPQVPVPSEEADRLTRELAVFLADMGQEVNRRVNSPQPVSTEILRTFVRDKVRGWRAYITVPGLWLRFVESLRPGTEAALLAEVESALPCLEYQPSRETKRQNTEPRTATSWRIERVIVEAKRLAVGLGFGLATYSAVVAWLTVPANIEEQSRHPALPGLVVTLIGLVSLLLATVLGYAAGRWCFRMPQQTPDQIEEQSGPTLWGWDRVASRVTTWFAERIRSRPLSPGEELQQLAARLNIGENKA